MLNKALSISVQANALRLSDGVSKVKGVIDPE